MAQGKVRISANDLLKLLECFFRFFLPGEQQAETKVGSSVFRCSLHFIPFDGQQIGDKACQELAPVHTKRLAEFGKRCFRLVRLQE